MKFVLLGRGRTGSTMLIQALNSHPAIMCFGAIFHRGLDFVDFSVEGYNNDAPDDRALRDRDPVAFLGERIFAEATKQSSAVGFKYAYGQANAFPGLLDHMVGDRELHVIHLKRQNVLRSMVSARIAEATGAWFQQPPKKRPLSLTPTSAVRALRNPRGAWHRIRGTTPSRLPAWKTRREPVTLPVQACIYEIETIQRQVDEHDELFAGHPMLGLHYEDLVADREAVFDNVQRFLGVEPRALTVTLERQNTEPLSALIANYGELASALRNTPWESFLD
jgi:LPS sulfotransferase NodH